MGSKFKSKLQRDLSRALKPLGFRFEEITGSGHMKWVHRKLGCFIITPWSPRQGGPTAIQRAVSQAERTVEENSK